MKTVRNMREEFGGIAVMINEAKIRTKKCVSHDARNDLLFIYKDNKEFGNQIGNRGWAKINNAHLRKEINRCLARLDESPVAYMTNNNKSPVYLFLVENLNRTKKYNVIAVFENNILEPV